MSSTLSTCSHGLSPLKKPSSVEGLRAAVAASTSQGLVKVGVTVRDLMAGWFGGAGLARGGVPGAGGCDGA